MDLGIVHPRRGLPVGKSVTLALYWALLAYVVAAGFVSIVPQVFWPRAGRAQAKVASSDSCDGGIRRLESELFVLGSAYLGGVDASLAAQGDVDFKVGLTDWDDQYHALSQRCLAPAQDALVALEQLRHRSESMWRSTKEQQLRMAKRIERQLHRP